MTRSWPGREGTQQIKTSGDQSLAWDQGSENEQLYTSEKMFLVCQSQEVHLL